MQSQWIKFRANDEQRSMLTHAARKAGMTVSELLRRAGRAAAAGRIASRPVLSDLVIIRSAANRLAALAENPETDPATMVEAVKAAADDLRAIAARHLANVR